VLNFFKAVFSFFSGIVEYLRQKDLIQAGVDKAVAKSKTEDLERVVKADEIREEARRDASAIPSDVSLPDDGFRRD
jgi:hypothetical protein